MNAFVLLAVAAVLIGLWFVKRMPILAWLAVWWVAVYVVLKYGIVPAVPTSIIGMFMGILTIALLAYLSSNSEYLAHAKRSTVAFLTEKRYNVALILTLVLIPLLVAWQVYSEGSAQPAPPAPSRTIHPPPPTTISFKGKTIDLVAVENPYRALEASDPDAFAAHVTNGRRVYYENCHFCHGDNMEGDGQFAHGFDPIPANFADPTTIAMLQESYIFWRIAKGAPGLPSESTPWASAMPAWENFLTEEEIWDVTTFLYTFTDSKPRAKEEGH